MDADCEAQLQARAEAEIECQPPQIAWSGNPDGLVDVAMVTHSMARIIAASVEVTAVLDRLGTFAIDIDGVANAVADNDLDATDAACALTQLGDVVSAIGDVEATLTGAVDANVLLLCI